MNAVEFLERSPIFGTISRSSLRALASICILKSLSKKEFIFWEKDKGSALYLLIAGNVQLFKTGPDGKESVIKIVKPGELFGEVILFESDRYPVSAQALSDCRIYLIPRHQLICLLNSPDFRDEFIGSLLGKMRYLTAQIQYLTDHDVDERFMLFLKNQFGEESRIHTRLSRKDVASAIHTTPETFSRLLNRLQKDNHMHWKGNTIEIEPEYWRYWNEKRDFG